MLSASSRPVLLAGALAAGCAVGIAGRDSAATVAFALLVLSAVVVALAQQTIP